MKMKNARKITSLLLALMLVLPVISVPAIADDTTVAPDAPVITAPNALFSQNFDDLDAELAKIVKGPSSLQLVEVEGRGNVIQIDCAAVGDETKYYVHFNKDKNTWATVSNASVSQQPQDDGSYAPYLTGDMKTPEGSSYKIAGWVNTDSCAIELDSVKDADGNDVAYKDIIVKGSKMVNAVDENGKVIWVPVLDENGEQVIGEQVDENGNVIQVPVMVDKLDENGNPVLDSTGKVVQVQKTEIVYDENGEPVMIPVTNEDGRPVYERDENGKVKRDENNKPIPQMTEKTQLVYEPSIGPVSKTVRVKINDSSSYVANSCYIVTEQFRDGFGGGLNNIATPAYVQTSALKSDVLIFCADYYFSEDLTRGMDIRVNVESVSGASKAWDFMSLANPSNGTITLKAHEGDAKMQLIAGNKTVQLGNWVNIMIAADLRTGTYAIYIDGELMCVRQDIDFSGTTLATGQWVEAAASVKANTWNLGHFTRGGNVSDYDGYVQIDNLAVYAGTSITDVFAYMNYSIDSEEDYENMDTGTEIAYSSTAKAIVSELNGTKAAKIDFAESGNIDQNYMPSVSGVTYLDTDTVVLEADYYLTLDAYAKFQAQFYRIGAHADVDGGAFGYPGQSNKTFSWIDLYTIDATGGSNAATVTFYGADATATVEKGRWNTFSTVISLKDGSYTLYINGVPEISGRLAKLVSGNMCYFTDISIAASNWIVAKIMKGNITRQGSVYIDELMMTKFGTEKANTVMIEAMLSAKIYANGEFYKTVTDTNVFYQSSDIVIEAETFDLKEQVGTDRLLTMDGASIRFYSPTGLRFSSRVDVDALNALYAMVGNTESTINLQSVSFGTLIVPTDTLNGNAVTFEALDAAGIPYLNVVGTKDCYYDLDGDASTTHISGSIIDIKESNITRMFTGVNYIQIVLPNGIVYNIYSDRDYRASAQSVADDAWGTYASAEQAVIDAFLAGVKPATDTPSVTPPVEDGSENG